MDLRVLWRVSLSTSDYLRLMRISGGSFETRLFTRHGQREPTTKRNPLESARGKTELADGDGAAEEPWSLEEREGREQAGGEPGRAVAGPVPRYCGGPS
jgi:hypothetical protein